MSVLDKELSLQRFSADVRDIARDFLLLKHQGLDSSLISPRYPARPHGLEMQNFITAFRACRQFLITVGSTAVMTYSSRFCYEVVKTFFNNSLELPALIEQLTFDWCSRLMEVNRNKKHSENKFCTHKDRGVATKI